MPTRRELLPLVAGATGAALAGVALARKPATAEPQLRRVSYQSARTGTERDYLVYLPPHHAARRDWPVMLFLHGDGERGDGKGELDYVLKHGPLFEAWCQKRDLPFIIVSPQLPKFGMADVDYIRNRTPAEIPRRRAEGVDPRPDERQVRLEVALRGEPADNKLPDGPAGETDGWSELESELLTMLDRTLADFGGDAHRVYLTGISSGAFGAWFLGARHAGKFAALAPVCGYGHPEHAAAIALSGLPLWCFAGGRDAAVPIRYFYTAFNSLEALGYGAGRLTVHEDLGHLSWVRVYGGNDLYDWMLSQSR